MQQSDDSAVTSLSAASMSTVVLLMATAALGHFNRVGMAVAGGERLMSEYGLSETELGMVYSAFLLAYTLCMIPGGWLIDRFGAPLALSLMGCGMAVFVAATGAIGLSAGLFSHGLLLGIRACAGACSAPLHPACARMVSLCVPRSRQTLANGLVTGAAVLGVAMTFKVFGGLIDRLGWQRAFLASAAATAILAVVWTVATRSAPTGARPKAIESEAELPPMSHDQRWRLTWLTISFAALGYFEYLFFYWLQHYLTNSLKMPTEDARWAASVPMIGMAVGMPIGGWLSDRLTAKGAHRGWTPATGLVLAAVFVLFGANCRFPIPCVVCFTFAMTAAGACEATYWTTSTKIGGARGGTAAAILNTGSNAGGMLAPVVTPLLSGVLGWQGAISVVSCICLPAAMLWIWIGTDEPTAIKARQPNSSLEHASYINGDEQLAS